MTNIVAMNRALVNNHTPGTIECVRAVLKICLTTDLEASTMAKPVQGVVERQMLGYASTAVGGLGTSLSQHFGVDFPVLDQLPEWEEFAELQRKRPGQKRRQAMLYHLEGWFNPRPQQGTFVDWELTEVVVLALGEAYKLDGEEMPAVAKRGRKWRGEMMEFVAFAVLGLAGTLAGRFGVDEGSVLGRIRVRALADRERDEEEGREVEGRDDFTVRERFMEIFDGVVDEDGGLRVNE